MIELTIPSDSRAAKERKNNKPNYNSLIGDLEDCGLSVNYRMLEIDHLVSSLLHLSLISTYQIRNETSSS